jgi:hypothetical protein
MAVDTGMVAANKISAELQTLLKFMCDIILPAFV